MICSAGAEKRRQTNYTAVAIKQVNVKKACDRTDGNHAAILLLLRQEATPNCVRSSQGSNNMAASSSVATEILCLLTDFPLIA
jgi:hypothetical protein